MNETHEPRQSADGELLLQCFAAGDDGGDPTLVLEDLCRAHPARADELRRLYATLDRFGLAHEPAGDAAPPERVGPYRVLELLGSGGMGMVWLAEHESLGRRVALKVLHPGLADTPRARERFRREALAAAKLDHPGICPVYEIGSADGAPFLAMRFVPGRSLQQVLVASHKAESTHVDLKHRDGDDARGAILRFVEQAAHALHVAHDAGLVHRDVKPGNLLVSTDGEPVLVDFGLARLDDGDGADAEESLTLTGDQLGTPGYMAPEQVRGGPVDRRTDVHALGVVLYECLTLELPFTAANRHDLHERILRSEAPDPRRTHRLVDADTWTVLQTALAKEPDRRYHTAAAFAEDLRRLRLHEPILARRAGPAQRLWGIVRRHPIAAIVFGMLASAVIVFAWLIEARNANLAALRATANARTSPAVALASVLPAVTGHRSVENLSALNEVMVVQHERLRLLHGATTWRLAFSDDGERLFTSCDDGAARVFDRRGQMLKRTGHGQRPGFGSMPVIGLEVAPHALGESERFVTAAQDGSARVFDRDGNELQCFDHRTEHNQQGGPPTTTEFFDPCAYPRVYQARWSPDATRIATNCSDHLVRVWRLGTKTPLCELRGHHTRFVQLAWSRDGWLASGDDQQNWGSENRTFVVIVWQPSGDGYVEAGRFEVPDSVHELAFAPDGQSLAAACHDGHAYVWQLAGGKPLRLAHGGPVWSVDWDPVGLRLLTASADHSVRLWSRDGVPLATGQHDDLVLHAHFAGGGDRSGPLRVLSTSLDQTVRVWDEQLHAQFVLRGHDDLTVHAALSPDGRRVASTSWDGTVRIWDLFDQETPRLVEHRGPVRGLARLPDGRIVSVADDRTARLWDLATGQSVMFPLPAAPWNLDVSRDGRLLLVGSQPDGAHAFDLTRLTQVARYPCPRTQWTTAVWLSDGRALVAGRTVVQALAGDTATTWSDVDNAFYALAASPERRLVAAVGRANRVQLWSEDGKDLPGPGHAAFGWAISVAWSPDASRLATGSHSGGEVWVWDVPANVAATWPAPVRLGGHDRAVNAVAWSPSGRLLAAGVGDGSVHLWDAARHERIAVLRGHGTTAVHAVVFASEDLLLSGGGDGAIQGWATAVDRQVQIAAGRLPQIVDATGPGNRWVFLLENGRVDEAHRVGLAFFDDPQRGSNPGFLRWMASAIVRPGSDLAQRHPQLLALAERAAARSLELANPPDNSMLATMARVQCCKGDLAQAVHWQTRAVEATATYRSYDRQRMEELLAEYRGMLVERR